MQTMGRLETLCNESPFLLDFAKQLPSWDQQIRQGICKKKL